LVTALISAYLAGYYAFFGIIAFISLYYVYSIPPLRLKRIPLFSSFIISLACLTIAISGFFTFSVTKQLDQFPIQAIIGLIVVTFLWAHVRDLKDVEGDRSAHIATLPVLCGPTWGPRVVGMSAASAFIVASLFIHTIFIYSISVAGALLTYYVVTRKPYREYPLFIIYFVWVIIAFLVL
jgi:4-hydroxybenzoate polyprenyltransferase